jgi:hypothetical protein
MAFKFLNSTIAKAAAAALVSAVILALGVEAYAQKLRPGCVKLRDERGRSYVSCKAESRAHWRTPRARSAAPGATPPSARRVAPRHYYSRQAAPSTYRAPSPLRQAAPSVPRQPAIIRAPAHGGAGGGGGSSSARIGAPAPSPTAPPAPPRNEVQVPGPTTDSQPRPGPTAAGGLRQTPSQLRAVRALIEPAAMPPRDVAGYGIVAFTTRPLAYDVERYKAVCEAYKATLTSVMELPLNTPPSEQMITYWPVTNKNTPEAQRADCAHLVANYALRLGLDAIQDADKRKEGLASHRGPFLIAWAPSDSRFVPDALVLVMDLSTLDTPRSFVEVFQDWRQHITDNPQLWRRNGFNVEAVRRIIRDTFDRYGDGLMRLINKT